MTIPYTYLIRFKPTNSVYYGVRYAENCDPSELWVTYFTSSKIIKRLINEFGYQSFEHEIRKTFDSKKAARDWEQKVLRRIDAENHYRFLNRSNNLKGVLRHLGEYEWCYNPNSNQKILVKKSEPLSDEWIRGARGPDMKQKGTILAYDPETLKHKRFRSNQDIPNHYVIGRSLSTTKGKIWIFNETTKERKLIDQSIPILHGWKKGVDFLTNRGRIKITKDGQVKSIFKEQLMEFICDGWTLGNPKSKNWTFFRFDDQEITNIVTTTSPTQYQSDGWIQGKPNLYKIIFADGSEVIAPWQIIEKVYQIPRCMIIYSSSRAKANAGHSTKYGYKKIIRVT